MIEHHGLVNPDNAKMIARHEVYCTLEDIIVQTAKLLKNSGKFIWYIDRSGWRRFFICL